MTARFWVKLGFCSLLTWIAYRQIQSVDPRYTGIAFAFMSMLWAHLFARDMLNLLAGIRHQAAHDVLHPWSGRYYNFDGHHLRFYFQNEQVWIPVKDLHAIMKPAFSARELRLLGTGYGLIESVKEHAISEQGLQVLLKNRTAHRRADYQMIRFKRWLNHEALPNVKRLPRTAAS